YFLREGCAPAESYRHAMRIFRGSLPSGGGPFTKDLSYGKGFLRVYRFLRQVRSRNEMRLAPLLFCGKTHLDDLPALAHLADEALVAPPRFLPPPFADLRRLGACLRSARVFNGPSPDHQWEGPWPGRRSKKVLSAGEGFPRNHLSFTAGDAGTGPSAR